MHLFWLVIVFLHSCLSGIMCFEASATLEVGQVINRSKMYTLVILNYLDLYTDVVFIVIAISWVSEYA